MKFSVIIISFNEDKRIANCIDSVQVASTKHSVEIIVADGGSSDSTCQIAETKGVKILNSKPGRGVQSNFGASVATGNIFIFLHADSIFPKDGFSRIEDLFSNQNCTAATFRLKFDKEKFVYSFYSWFTKFDSIFTSFGDQCIVIRKDIFNEVGGYPDWQIFEDVNLLQKVRRKYEVHSIPSCIITSARRFERNGILFQQLRNFYYIILYLLGVNTDKLKNMYSRSSKLKRLKFKRSVILFAREPELGKVKTRLANSIGDEQALKIYECLLENIFNTLKKLEGVDVNIFWNRENEFFVEQKNNLNFNYHLQEEGDLGEKLSAAFKKLFNSGSEHVVVVGSDIPDINSQTINQAYSHLLNNDVVIGKGDDGGYYLIGMNKFYPQLFENISWSTEEVLNQTIEKINKLGLSYKLLAEKIDIDTVKDLENWLSSGKSNQLKNRIEKVIERETIE